jgi:hypothetical protein
MKPLPDGRVEWHYYRIPRLAGLSLAWSLYSELHETTVRWQSKLVILQDSPGGRIGPSLEHASLLGASYNLRQMAESGGATTGSPG